MVALDEEKFNKRRLAGSYITSVVSIWLVLFVLGLFGLILINAQSLSLLIRENIGLEVILKKGVNEASILQYQKMLEAEPFVKSARYIPREEATRVLADDLGEDFVRWLGDADNPLLPSIELKFKADWATNDSLEAISRRLLLNPDVKEVYYQKTLIDLVNDNFRRISIILLGFGSLLLLIAIVLIHNTIRLSIYAKRFIIRSMQLVGATEGFIHRPFFITAFLQGLISAVLALLLLSGVLYAALGNIPELLLLYDPVHVAILFGATLLTGILLTTLSTWIALRRYLRVKTDKLFI
ncbi:MAG: permease-like cell division protein FtsX [Bacteroidia bacterium]|jgi:cell division transport system permease protein|nr:permease-like cell division protein FtsX [Bacteroidia bacterium]